MALAGAVRDSPDLKRVLALPRRRYEPEVMDTIASRLTAAFAQPGGPGEYPLRPIQGVALLEIGRLKGGIIPIRVGGGKTLVSFLAPNMFPDVVRPLIVVPANLREKTERALKAMRKYYRISRSIQIRSYETLSTEANAELLFRLKPDFIFFDESHKIKNGSAAVTARVTRYVEKHLGHVRVVCASGTMHRGRIGDYAHYAVWCLGEGAPIPISKKAQEEWAGALDVNVPFTKQKAPGALAQLRSDPMESLRTAFRRRFTETPGVICSQDPPLTTPSGDPIDLRITSHLLEAPAKLKPIWETFRTEWETPDGWDCADGVEMARHAKTLGVGYYQVWDPRPPVEWADARTEWMSEARKVVKRNRRDIDTEKQVRTAVRAGHYPHLVGILDEWEDQKPTFIPNPTPYWVSDHAIKWILRWAKKNDGIIWTQNVALGKALEKKGLRFFQQEARHAASGTPIMDARPEDGAIVASIDSCSTGQDLQRWTRNLVVGCPSSGEIWEQMIGRTHRDGQKATEVTFEVLMGCREHVRSFWEAVEESSVVSELTGQSQKLQYADTNEVHALEDLRGKRCHQWRKNAKQETE